ncbi:FliM/FliN family flagellar motor switch protein [Erythrobacter sp. SCSIO 43205]|uniref:FliM/FliN family flagellar motor switch protein n=1 Tax=Erythrobacter sp. SCSIO 43205 TaxID=2779361 RepID=UPI001CAA3B3E|nr:flagellar motor switch protein FliM [Erythrobacter sp. SCSIO 43205]UAB78746.1 FliM/FliN family flagellar motor switch protein [Erythrobacter sp. SCSIO 43205]
MNMAGAFAADFAGARAYAQHCSELTWRGPRPEEREGAIAAWKRDLASELAQELGQILTGEKLEVTIGELEVMTGAQVFAKIGESAVNTLLRIGTGDQTVLLSLDFSTAIALTDCSFGGEGAAPESVPAQLPRSAGLLVEQFGASVAQVIAMARATSEPARGEVLVRSESVVRLKPFSAEAQITVLNVTIAKGAFIEWQMLIALPSEQLDDLLPKANSTRSALAAQKNADADADPFAEVPLVLEAVLTEFELPLARIERLQPGDEIALNIPRELPLRIGGDVFARGVPGTFEDHMALRLTNVPHRSEGAAL